MDVRFKHWRPTKCVGYFAQSSCNVFPASGCTNAVFQSIFPIFLCRFTQNLFMCNVLNFEYRDLFIACKNWLCGYEIWMKAIFSWLKNTLFNSQFSSQNTGDHILGLWNSTIFWGSMPPDPPRRRELTARCWYSRLLYSNLLATSIIIIETPGFKVMADFRVCRLSCWLATGNFGCR